MAIQIRNGTNTEWESNNSNIVVGEPAIATDAERFFVGTASGDYAEFANLDIIAPAYDTTTSYVVGDIINYHGKLYSCNAPCSGTFNPSYWDEKSLAEILKDLENEINYAQYEIGYASGELITINNGASEIPVKDLTLDIDAVQDLHGYDHPWVGGAGKNKLPCREAGTQTTQGLTITFGSDGTITVNGTATAATLITIANVGSNNKVYLPAGTYTISGGNSSNYWVGIFKNKTTGNWDYTSGGIIGSDTFTITEGDYIYPAIRVGNGVSLSNYKFYPMIRPSTESATYEPYENICLINGWDEVNVNVSGVNVWDEEWEVGYISVSNGNNSSSSVNIRSKNYIPVLPNASYYLKTSVGTVYCPIIFYDANKNFVSSVAQTIWNRVITVPSNASYMRFYMHDSYGTTYNNDISINYPSTNHDYHAYNGQTYTIDLDGTRYGGTLDVTTGVLTVTHGYFDLGSTNYVYSSNYGGYFYVGLVGKKAGDTNIYADCYANAGVTSIQYMADSTIKGRTADSYIFIKDSRFADAGDLKTALNGHYAVYELATPLTVQLTPTQVRTLLGTNNLWNQMNSNNELAYRISNALN